MPLISVACVFAATASATVALKSIILRVLLIIHLA